MPKIKQNRSRKKRFIFLDTLVKTLNKSNDKTP